MPIREAKPRATGTYSSALTSRARGTTIRSLGASGVCLCVVYTQAAQVSSSASVSHTSGVPKSISRARAERHSTEPFLRLPSARWPATKPPTSFTSDCSACVIFRNWASVSGVRCVCPRRSHNSAQSIVLFSHLVEVRRGAVEIFSCMCFILSCSRWIRSPRLRGVDLSTT